MEKIFFDDYLAKIVNRFITELDLEKDSGKVLSIEIKIIDKKSSDITIFSVICPEHQIIHLIKNFKNSISYTVDFCTRGDKNQSLLTESEASTSQNSSDSIINLLLSRLV